MPAEWLALGSSLPAALVGTHLACAGVSPATAASIGVNHSALSWVEWSSDNKVLRRVAGGGAGLVWACVATVKAAVAAKVRARRDMRNCTAVFGFRGGMTEGNSVGPASPSLMPSAEW